MGDSCRLCPRVCGAKRILGELGACRAPAEFLVARAAPHFGEEPCISGSRGSGTVFFSGCALGCVFCQNQEISRGQSGFCLTQTELRQTFLQLQETGVHNLNLVTAGHYADRLAELLEEPVGLPVVWNSGGYETVETLYRLKGKVDVYMPDLKFLNSDLAARYCAAPEYPQIARAAILEMYAQVGDPVFDEEGLLMRGLLLRHLVMPGAVENSLDVIDWVAEHFSGGRVVFSLMGQYTPMGGCEGFPELSQPVTREEYQRVTDYLACVDLPLGYIQELAAAGTEQIPAFDGTGLEQFDISGKQC